MPVEFEGKNILLVDDSIVRGTTMEQIVRMARESGAKKVLSLIHIYGAVDTKSHGAENIRNLSEFWYPRNGKRNSGGRNGRDGHGKHRTYPACFHGDHT